MAILTQPTIKLLLSHARLRWIFPVDLEHRTWIPSSLKLLFCEFSAFHTLFVCVDWCLSALFFFSCGHQRCLLSWLLVVVCLHCWACLFGRRLQAFASARRSFPAFIASLCVGPHLLEFARACPGLQALASSRLCLFVVACGRLYGFTALLHSSTFGCVFCALPVLSTACSCWSTTACACQSLPRLAGACPRLLVLGCRCLSGRALARCVSDSR